MNDRPKAGKRIQIYMDARHVDWWQGIERWQRSRIVAEALDLYRETERSGTDKRAESDTVSALPQQDAE